MALKSSSDGNPKANEEYNANNMTNKFRMTIFCYRQLLQIEIIETVYTSFIELPYNQFYFAKLRKFIYKKH